MQQRPHKEELPPFNADEDGAKGHCNRPQKCSAMQQSSYRNGVKKGSYCLKDRQRIGPQLSKLRSKIVSIRIFYYFKLGPCHTQAISTNLKAGSLIPFSPENETLK
jgi:hypothetical protein